MSTSPLSASDSSARLQAAVIVAHPDDEILWCGGYVLNHPEFVWRILTLCRASDIDRAPRFYEVMERLQASGAMADLDDGPDQTPLAAELVRQTAERLLAGASYDLILTHGPHGEYTSHRRHGECCKAVVELWRSGTVGTRQLWMFAYEDGERSHLPRARADADRLDLLTPQVWSEKRRLIMELYGFGADSWEVMSAPQEEGFWCFDSPQAAVERTGLWGPRS